MFIDLDGVTGVDFVTRAREALASEVTLPEGYSLEWTGTYRYATEARDRLLLVVPATVLITLLLLWLALLLVEPRMS